ncbi:MAG: hypothetical protein JNL60_16685 [Bacteroidia bacterium]|nr:hypothetical protein [Bacteroidia bacterium]
MSPERILIFPFDLLSHYLRCIELTKLYPEAEIFFASSGKYDHHVQKAGHKCFDVEKFDSTEVMECAEKFDFSWLNKTDLERVFLSQVQAIKKLKPNRVIGDTSPTLKMAAEYCEVNYTALMNGYMSRHYACLRMLPQSHPGYPYLSKVPPNIRKVIVRFAEWISFRLVHKPFKELRRKYGLKYIFNYLSEMEGDLNLLCDDDYLFPQKKLPANYKMIGPLIYEGGENISDILKDLRADKKNILVCMGSSGDWKALQFLSSPLYNRFTIITAGDRDHIITGDHVVARPFLCLKSVLPHCSMLICHGGNGTIYHGLRNHLPILCLTSHFEQEWNVQRLEALNLGIHINANPKAMIEERLATV